jgi:hypothetical protein
MAFKGTVESDFLKLAKVEEVDKQKLINFASTDFLTLRDSLLNYIKAVYPLDYNYFSESDFGMMLIELVSYMGHILSYKADYLANENFLKTARSRESVRNLMQLIGIRMKGPIAAAANASLTLDQPVSWSVTGTGSYVTVSAADRVISITSPEDNLPLTYTLYKVSPDGDIDTANANGSIVIYESEKTSANTLTNLVLLEGSLVIEQGTFVDTESLKSVKLQQGPIIEGSVQTVITGQESTNGVYRQVDNLFFASGSDDKVFQLISDNNYGGIVVFGDSNLGKVPAIGDSYTIIYRIGGGSRGNIISNLINAPVNITYADISGTYRSLTATVVNTSQGTGGTDAETIAHVKKYGPLMFRSQNRLVTLSDYKTFVNSYISSYGSVGKATVATRRAYSSANIIDVYVLEKTNNTQLRKATPEFKRQIAEAIQDKKMLTDEVVMVDGLIRTLDVQISLRLDKKYETLENTIKSKVNNKISEFFNIDNTDFGKEFNPQDLMYSIFEVEEIRFATIDNIPEAIQVNFNEIVQLNNYTLNFYYV